MKGNLFKKYYWVLFPIVTVFLLGRTYISSYFDDTLIYLRYVKNFQDGYGLVYNIGDKFNGLTSPLYSYIVVLFSYVTPSGYLIEMNNFLSGFFLLLTSIITAVTFFNGNTNHKILVSVIISAFPYFYSVFGMESNLIIFLISLVFYYYKKGSPFYFIVLAALIITRSEGVFLAIPFALDYVLKHQKLPNFKLLFCCFVICAIPYLFNYLYYGAMLPSSASAKLLQGKSGLWGENKILNFQSWEWRGIFGFHLRYYLIFIGLAIAGFILSTNKRLSVIICIYIVLLLTFYQWFNIPDYFWYKAPIVYILLTFSLIGFKYLGDKFRIKNEILGSLISVVLLVIFLFKFSLFSLEKTSFIPIRSSIPVTENFDYKNIGLWISKNTPNNSTIAMVEIGIVGYFADRKIIDILGLVNEYNAEFIGNRDLFSWLTHYQPEYILVHKPIYSWEYSIEPLRKNQYYILDKTFVNPVSEQSYELYRRTEINTENIKALGEEFSKKKLFE